MQSYKHFTLDEREKLVEYLDAGLSLTKIAKQLGRAVSSISREIKRNRNKGNGKYSSWRANSIAVGRSRRKKYFQRLAEGTELREFVCKGLSKYWSPECIAACWNRDHQDDKVGFSTIYRWLKRKLIAGYSRTEHLRRRGKKIQTRNANYNTIHPDRLIADWPQEIKDRKRIGDWEGDTVYGGIGKGFLVTCVDRRSRFLVAEKVLTRKPEDTKDAIIKALNKLPVKSISLDNGAEFASFKELEKELNTEVYFAHPHAPWERGTNENTNGILRFFFKKGYDFISLSDDELQYVVELINNRPRKCLGWKTPAEIFNNSCCT